MRLVDADPLLEQMKRRKDYVGRPSDPVCLVEDAPTVDAVPVKHGRWVFGVDSETGERDLYAWTCSECNEKYPWQPNYCPNCGAKMDGERRESE